MSIEKRACCQYKNERADDAGVEALKLYLPVSDGFINYNIVHSVTKGSNCNTWRLSVVYHCDDELQRVRPLTRTGAEWEMALMIQERPDFIGGYAHGDEVYEKLELTVDGKKVEKEELSELVTFDELIAEVWSVGYDPLDSATKSLLHYKKITIDKEQVKVEQSVEWLNDYLLGKSYMAMMPPYKKYTDHFSTDTDPENREIGGENHNIPGAGSATLTGESGHLFKMSVPVYPCYESGGRLLIQDNGGNPYNKMYFPICLGGVSVKAGEVWKTRTEYEIKICKLLPKQ